MTRNEAVFMLAEWEASQREADRTLAEYGPEAPEHRESAERFTAQTDHLAKLIVTGAAHRPSLVEQGNPG